MDGWRVLAALFYLNPMVSDNFFTASEDLRSEYCAKIVRIGEQRPIEGSDFLLQTIVDGFSVVVPKGLYSEGQAVVYCMNETRLNRNFLSANNQFELKERQMNANHAEVEKLMRDGKEAEAKKLVGFFNKRGRVKMIRLRGCPSYGCIFSVESLKRWKPQLADINLEDFLHKDEHGREVPFEFDTVCGDLFAEVYVPHVNLKQLNKGRKMEMLRERMLAKFDRLIPGQFQFHYDTMVMQSNMWYFLPDMRVTVSVKMHGTSVILGNVLTKIPIQLSASKQCRNKTVARRLKNIERQAARFPWQKTVQAKQREAALAQRSDDFRIGYGMVYSSRTVIKNRYINKNLPKSFYEVDIWTEYAELLCPYIAQGITVYGEICGYLSGSGSMIQKDYDYGCKAGENFMLPYRITETDSDGKKKEWEVSEVVAWTQRMIAEHEDLAQRLRPMTILYHGSLADMYPSLDPERHWNENLLEAMKKDSTMLGMEKNEPMCLHKVPREGICLRIDGDERKECFKLKTDAFFLREQQLVTEMENGTVQIDPEMAQAY